MHTNCSAVMSDLIYPASKLFDTAYLPSLTTNFGASPNTVKIKSGISILGVIYHGFLCWHL